MADDAERSRRDALLLELGALVYELHRHGRRAPELLQEKAAELDALEDSEHEPQGGGEPCPTCGEPADSGQLVCLNCGARLRLDREREQKRRVGALAALLAVVVLGAGAAGFGLSELTSESDSDDAPTAERPAERAAEPEPTLDAPTETEPPPQPKGDPQAPKRSLLLKWPAGLTAHTVILVNAEDRGSARRVAIEAARSGIETGLLRSEDHDLGSGLWIVFAGRFDTQRSAERQAEGLSGRYPGAYVQLVEPRSQ